MQAGGCLAHRVRVAHGVLDQGDAVRDAADDQSDVLGLGQNVDPELAITGQEGDVGILVNLAVFSPVGRVEQVLLSSVAEQRADDHTTQRAQDAGHGGHSVECCRHKQEDFPFCGLWPRFLIPLVRGCSSR